MVVGAHSGDAEVMAGTIIRQYTRGGHQAYLVAMTHGERGHPTLSRHEYRKQKECEALQAAAILDVKPIFLPFGCGEERLAVSAEIQGALVAVINEHRPDVLITHWKESCHTEHTATHYNALAAIRQTNGIVKSCFFAENWEDAPNYRTEIYLPISEDDEADWLMACDSFQFFRDGFYDFPYRRYYQALHFIRGAESSRPLSCTLMRQPVAGKYIEPCIPGYPL